MKRTFVIGSVALALALSAPAVLAGAAATDQKPADAKSSEPAPIARADTARPPDNTGVNARDKSHDTTLPTDQSNAKSDLELAAAIRKAIVDDKSLSVIAQNVKVVTQGGTVTLRGPVQTADEKTRIGQLARNTAGVKSVDNQLDIKQR